MYKVFSIDDCFDQYASSEVLVGANSVKDLLNHFKDIYPDNSITVKREDWMDEDDWQEECQFGKFKDGDTIMYSRFSEEEMQEFIDSLNTKWPRIKEIPGLFTYSPYKILYNSVYIE